jgi:paraquat-inducible protein B
MAGPDGTERKGAVLVGGFVIAALAVAVAAALFFGAGRLWEQRLVVVSYFDGSVGGLSIGAPVSFRGVPVGRVERIQLQIVPEDVSAQIAVYMSLEPGVVRLPNGQETVLQVPDFDKLGEIGLRAQLVTLSLITGQLGIQLDFRPETPARLLGLDDTVPEIASIRSEIQAVKDTIAELPLQEAVKKLIGTLTAVQRLSDIAADELSGMSGRVGTTMDRLDDSLDMATVVLLGLEEETRTALRSVTALSDGAGAEVGTTAADVRKVLENADRTLVELSTLTQTLNQTINGRSVLRQDVEAAARDLAVATRALRSFAETIEREPNLLILGR